MHGRIRDLGLGEAGGREGLGEAGIPGPPPVAASSGHASYTVIPSGVATQAWKIACPGGSPAISGS